MQIQDLVAIGPKTTMKIGGQARAYGEAKTREDIDQALLEAKKRNLPLIFLGGGSNTVFADGVMEALVVRMKNEAMAVDGNSVTIGAGKILGSLLNELAAKDLDLSALTGIPGTLGGAIFGNAGQGPKGNWIDSFVESVTANVDGEWKTFAKEACGFRYRESIFKDMASEGKNVVIWEATLRVPSRPGTEVKTEIDALLKKRIETQPHLKTAGSCFKALPDGTPAWKLIDAAGLRGTRVGGIEIAEKHANFLLNVDKGTFADVLGVAALIRQRVPGIAGIEMRLYGNDGKLAA